MREDAVDPGGTLTRSRTRSATRRSLTRSNLTRTGRVLLMDWDPRKAPLGPDA